MAAIGVAVQIFRFIFKSQGGTGLEALGEALLWAQLFLLFCVIVLPPFFRHLTIARSLPDIRKRIGGQCSCCGHAVYPMPKKCPECGNMVDIQQVDPQLPVQKVPRILVVRSDKLLPRRQFRVPGRKVTAL